MLSKRYAALPSLSFASAFTSSPLVRRCVRLARPKIEQEYKVAGAQNVLLVGTTTGSAGRQFPTLQSSILITRRSGYVLTNVAVPMSMYALMSLAQWSIPVQDTAECAWGPNRGLPRALFADARTPLLCRIVSRSR